MIGAGVGWLVAPTSKRSAAPAPALASSASNAALELRFPDGWRPTRAAPQVSGLELTDPVALAGISTRRRHHRRHQQGRRPDAAPVGAPRSPAHRSPAGDRREARSGQRRTATRGSRRARRLQRLTLYAIPTTKGVVTLACVDAAAGSPDCEAIASTLRLRNARAVPARPRRRVRACGRHGDRAAERRARERPCRAGGGQDAGRPGPGRGVARRRLPRRRSNPPKAARQPGRQRRQPRDRCSARQPRQPPTRGSPPRPARATAPRTRTASANVAQAEGRVTGAIAALRDARLRAGVTQSPGGWRAVNCAR